MKGSNLRRRNGHIGSQSHVGPIGYRTSLVEGLKVTFEVKETLSSSGNKILVFPLEPMIQPVLKYRVPHFFILVATKKSHPQSLFSHYDYRTKRGRAGDGT